jgi:hypothetical protein
MPFSEYLGIEVEYAEDGEETHVGTAHCTDKTDAESAGESPWTEGEGVFR